MITVVQEQIQVTVKQESKQVILQQVLNQIICQGGSIVSNILPFTFTCTTPGQTIFGPLPSSPTAVICLFITGAGQNQLAGDYTIQGLNIVLSSGVNIGDTVYGAYEV